MGCAIWTKKPYFSSDLFLVFVKIFVDHIIFLMSNSLRYVLVSRLLLSLSSIQSLLHFIVSEVISIVWSRDKNKGIKRNGWYGVLTNERVKKKLHSHSPTCLIKQCHCFRTSIWIDMSCLNALLFACRLRENRHQLSVSVRSTRLGTSKPWSALSRYITHCLSPRQS